MSRILLVELRDCPSHFFRLLLMVNSSASSKSASSSKNRKVAIALALAGALKPTPLPLSGLHKFYLGQPIWGGLYLLLSWTQIPRIACAIEGVWYLAQSDDQFSSSHGGPAVIPPTVQPQQVGAVAAALRELDRLRQDGLISEYEFEQKRRELLDQIS